MNREQLRPDDEILWRSPFTGNLVKVTYRGEHDGKAVVWSGTLQFSIEFKDIVEKSARCKV